MGSPEAAEPCWGSQRLGSPGVAPSAGWGRWGDRCELGGVGYRAGFSLALIIFLSLP